MLNPWYITGFCDRDGSFTYSRTGGTVGLYFSIRQREDNRPIIEEIRAYFHYVGEIYSDKKKLSNNPNSIITGSIYYRVTKIAELRIILEHFDAYPLQNKKKLEAYHVWRDMVMHKLDNYRDIDYNKLQSLAERLSNLNLQSRAYRYTRY